MNYTLLKECIAVEQIPVPDASWLPVAATIEESVSASGAGYETSALLTTETTYVTDLCFCADMPLLVLYIHPVHLFRVYVIVQCSSEGKTNASSYLQDKAATSQRATEFPPYRRSDNSTGIS